ncbi:uncharacterized protein PFLUO_LOCUS4293 [Penicillium psychrofluorescens]|uniref:uncharacterized protein n=1 Tax=Penicillium psychrofluorescens TaxID=3158075 RepID=UPI003CCE4338
MSDSSGAHKYRLKVTAGAEYDPATHQVVPVNGETLRIDNEHATVSLCVRINDYTGYPDDAPPTSEYFQHPLHTKDQYSISFSIIFKEPVNGNNLVFGNDFDHPIRDRLPPGFNAALRMVKWMLDPALEGDAYADKPYLFSPALATWNQFRVGKKIQKSDEVPKMHDTVVEEGADSDGSEIREKLKIPDSTDGRRHHFQNESNRKEFDFEPGRMYLTDFGNPYLVFNDFSIRLPGFTLHAMNYVDEKNHDLRYVLKDTSTDRVYLAVLFTLVLQGTDQEPEHKGDVDKGLHEMKTKQQKDNGSLGKFNWDSDSMQDVD